jgi:hypothetical protein
MSTSLTIILSLLLFILTIVDIILFIKKKALLKFMVLGLILITTAFFLILVYSRSQPSFLLSYNDKSVLTYEETHERIDFDGTSYKFKINKSFDKLANEISDCLDTDYLKEDNTRIYNVKDVYINLEKVADKTYLIYTDTIEIGNTQIPFPRKLVSKYYVKNNNSLDFKGQFSDLASYYTKLDNTLVEANKIILNVTKDKTAYEVTITVTSNKVEFKLIKKA